MSDFEIYLRNLNKSVIQIDYKFHLVPVDIRGDIDSLWSAKYGLEKSLNRKFHIENLTGYFEGLRGLGFYKHEVKIHSNFPYEICFVGCTRSIVSKNYKTFSEFNYEDYHKNKEDFIKNNPDKKGIIEMMFNNNIKAICSFYLITEKQLKTNKFNKLEQSIKRLNIKINNHATS